MQSQVLALLAQPILSGIGLILTIIFGLTSLVLYQKQKLHKDLWYFVEQSIHYDHPPVFTTDMGLDFMDEQTAEANMGPAKVLYRVTLWNRGKSTIEGRAISAEDPLILSVGEKHKVVSAKIAAESRKAVSAKTAIDKSKASAFLNFDFLDWRDGLEVHLVAEGPGRAQSTQERKHWWWPFGVQRRVGVQLAGTVMGLNQMNELRSLPMTGEITASLSFFSVALALLIGLVFSVCILIPIETGVLITGKYAAPALIFCLAALAFWGCVHLWHYRFFPSKTSWYRHDLGDSGRRRIKRLPARKADSASDPE